MPPELRLDDALPASESRARRFLRILAGLIAAALVLQGSFNYLVDPFSLYGSPTDLPRMRPVRMVKLEMLQEISSPPEALILGSSRVRMLEPARATRLFGLRTFHMGGPKGSPQNWLAVTRYLVEEQDFPIRLLIIGIDPSTFVDVPNYLHHPVNVPELRRHLRNPLLLRIRSLAHLWSPRQTAASVRTLFREQAPSGTAPSLWNEDGLVRGFAPLDPVAIRATSLALHRSHGVQEPEHLADFRELLEFARAHDIRIVAYVTPEAPPLRHLLERTHFPATRAELIATLEQAASDRFLLCDVDSLGLTRADFVDPHHPNVQASRRILDSLGECARRQGRD